MKGFIILILTIGVTYSSFSDYLIAHKNIGLKVAPQSSSDWVIGVNVYEGEMLELLNNGKQVNAYYKVRLVGTQNIGYIYRSLVKRIKSDLPSFYQKIKGVDIHIVDVGAGLGIIIKSPEDKYIIYDGGAYSHLYNYLTSIYPNPDTITYLIASHTDADHWGSIQKVVDNYQVNTSLITTFRPGGLSDNMEKARKSLESESNSKYIDLASNPIIPGSIIFQEGELTLRFLSGFGLKDKAFTEGLDNSSSTLRNAASIVLKLQYKENSILLTGDAAGLEECPKNECECEMPCIATEKFMLDSVRQHLESRLIVAGHHGARNSSCPEFIQAVNPEYVIFSAGNSHNHPHKTTALNFNKYAGVPTENMYRTDVGKFIADLDDNPCNDEWKGLNKDELEKDGSFDDHIRVQFTEHGRLLIGNM